MLQYNRLDAVRSNCAQGFTQYYKVLGGAGSLPAHVTFVAGQIGDLPHVYRGVTGAGIFSLVNGGTI